MARQVREHELDEEKAEADANNSNALADELAERKKTLEQWSVAAYGEVQSLTSRDVIGIIGATKRGALALVHACSSCHRAVERSNTYQRHAEQGALCWAEGC